MKWKFISFWFHRNSQHLKSITQNILKKYEVITVKKCSSSAAASLWAKESVAAEPDSGTALIRYFLLWESAAAYSRSPSNSSPQSGRQRTVAPLTQRHSQKNWVRLCNEQTQSLRERAECSVENGSASLSCSPRQCLPHCGFVCSSSETALQIC